MTVLITGARGFIGQALSCRTGETIVLSRSPERLSESGDSLFSPTVRVVEWNPQSAPPPGDVFDGVSTVFNLAGESVASGLWSEEKKRRIRDSRIIGTRHLVGAMASIRDRPRTLISASAIGFYGDRGDELLEEAESAGSDFLAGVCRAWEAEALKAADAGIRVSLVRIGIVLGSGGGALERMIGPFRFGLGGPMGSGKQWMSWIHLQDLVEALLFIAGNDSISGPVNLVAPNPVTNAEFSRTLGHSLHRPALIPFPAIALRLLFGEMSGVLLGSQRVLPKKLLELGFSFKFPHLRQALAQIL